MSGAGGVGTAGASGSGNGGAGGAPTGSGGTGAGASGLAIDVKTSPVSGTVTLNGANPMSNSSNCGTAAAASIYSQYARGDVILTDTTQGYSFTAFLQGCTNTTATFSAVVYPGRYEVTVGRFFSDLPFPAYVGVPMVTIP